MNIQDLLIQDEGLRLRVYLDTKGKMTIGVGRNLEDVGISESEALLFLENDVAIARRESAKFPFFPALDPVRQDVIICMVFNMGASKFSGFVRFMAAVDRKDYATAATEMINSSWSLQVGKRAVRLAEMMRSGVYQAS